MTLKYFQRINAVLSWIVFALAAITYLFTIEHSASLWDCPEFIICANKLEVGHPPGSPFFMLVYNIMSNLTSNPNQVATMCNATSGLLSAFTIMLLYLSISHMARRLLSFNSERPEASDRMELGKSIAIMAAALGGAMLYAFTDTFWYSAVEAEVYSFSSFFTALVFWLMLKWEERADNPRSDRWLILIAYFIGLGIAVHLLNLLCVPAMVLIFYFRKQSKPSVKGAMKAVLVSFVLVALILFGVIQGSMRIANQLDVFFVNVLKLPFNSGLIAYLLLLAVVIVWTLWSFHKKGMHSSTKLGVYITAVLSGIPFISSNKLLWVFILALLAVGLWKYKKLNLRILYTIQMSLVVLMLGYASYAVIDIRSAAQPPINENNPSTPSALRKYLNREQYGSYPLLYGQTFASQAIDQKEGPKRWVPAPKTSPNDKDRYMKVPGQNKLIYSSYMFMPRMWSSQPEHVYNYNIWIGRNPNDKTPPTFAQNISFMMAYQINYMYWRYFAWNFIGRQNDLQGDGSMLKGGVSTGFNVIDKQFYGDAQYYPSEIKDNKAHNVYYLMPLLLGLIGIFFLFSMKHKGSQTFWIILLFFLMTGLAIVFYINQTPLQPRERDYAYAGSFYAFAIWIGFGILAIWHIISKLSNKQKTGDGAESSTEVPTTANSNKMSVLGAVVAGLVAVAVPLQMLSQNYDDHDRSGRTVGSDMGYNLLNSLKPNAIVFCYGDNETFPVWYSQEVEGVRTDCRAANLSYLGAEWYVDQMRTQAHQSAPLPLKYMTPAFYHDVDHIFVNNGGAPQDINKVLEMTYKKSPTGDVLLPTDKLLLPIDSAVVAKQFPGLHTSEKEMLISLEGKHYLLRDGMVLLDLLANNNWQRPIYFFKSTPTNAFSNLNNYIASSGAAWQLLPVDLHKMPLKENALEEYDMVMHKFRWFGADNPNTYFDEPIRTNTLGLFRSRIIPDVAQNLFLCGEEEKAKEVIRKAFTAFNPKAAPYSPSDINLMRLSYVVGLNEEGNQVAKALLDSAIEKIDWVIAMRPSLQKKALTEGYDEEALTVAVEVLKIVESANQAEHFKKQKEFISNLLSKITGPAQAAH